MNTFLSQEIDDTKIPPSHRLWFGVLAATVADFTAPAYVILPDYDPKFQWGGCRWQARDATTLPQKGDECILAFDSRNQPWIIAWWPFV